MTDRSIHSAAPPLRIPFNRSSLVGREMEHIARAMQIGQIAGDQAFTQQCHALLEQLLGVRKALLTTSCTHALEMAAILLGIKPGDEVIVPSFTFVSTVNAFVLRGATPIFADIREDTLNLDETNLEALISPRTRAIVPVHYAGVGCEMNSILALARQSGIHVVEDNAHGLLGAYRGQKLGTFGTFGVQSFHETKNVTCGEGGAFLINDPAYIERAEIIREKGTNRCKYFRGQIDRYSWVDMGSSYLMSDVLAAFLFGQLNAIDMIQSRRRALWETYNAGLKQWAAEQGVRTPYVPSHCGQAYHMYYLLMPSLEARERLIARLRSRGILAVFHYLPLHTSLMGKQFGGRFGDCPVSERISDRLIRLPFYLELNETDQSEVIKTVCNFDCAGSGGNS